ncbi:MAG: hypothetical protein ACYC0C_04895 [Devosia sp.]
MTVAAISHIRMELAREPGHPLGDRDHVYHLYLPLTADGHIDAEAWRHNRSLSRVRRLRPGETEARGLIVHGPGGRWIFDYTDETDRDNESGFRLKDERFVQGEYVSIREDDGKMHTFQIVSVQPA